ncbi:MAG: hypothetical protein IPM17_03380 [Verrucomicrobia bacterium]|nr:hypothetical protein [Verrucomicrobiota bacterium]
MKALIKTLGRSLIMASLALAIIGILSAPSTALAQQKGAEKLMQMMKPVKTAEDLQALEAGDVIAMSCPKCKNTAITVVEKTFKAVKPEELKTLQVHLCDSCETKIVTKGRGKQAQNVLVHTCKTCGSKDAFCCVQKKGSGPTPGMEKK